MYMAYSGSISVPQMVPWVLPRPISEKDTELNPQYCWEWPPNKQKRANRKQTVDQLFHFSIKFQKSKYLNVF